MKKLLLLSLTLLMLPYMFFNNSLYDNDFLSIDNINYRYYHDMDNEIEGSKYRTYMQLKKFYKNKLKFAYERKRMKRYRKVLGFIDHSIKF